MSDLLDAFEELNLLYEDACPKLIKCLMESSARELEVRETSDIIDEAISKLNSIGFDIPADLRFDVFESTATMGQCVLSISPWSQSGTEIIVRLNRFILKEGLEDLIINNVYHELCHYMQNKEMLAAKISIDYSKRVMNFSSPEEAEYFEAAEGHSKCWHKYVDLVNTKLKPRIPVVATLQFADFERYLVLNDDAIKFWVACEKCGRTAPVLTYMDVNRDIPYDKYLYVALAQKKHVHNNFCRYCGGELVVKPQADSLEEVIDNLAIVVSPRKAMSINTEINKRSN